MSIFAKLMHLGNLRYLLDLFIKNHFQTQFGNPLYVYFCLSSIALLLPIF
jgi:hypothetical protein